MLSCHQDTFSMIVVVSHRISWFIISVVMLFQRQVPPGVSVFDCLPNEPNPFANPGMSHLDELLNYYSTVSMPALQSIWFESIVAEGAYHLSWCHSFLSIHLLMFSKKKKNFHYSSKPAFYSSPTLDSLTISLLALKPAYLALSSILIFRILLLTLTFPVSFYRLPVSFSHAQFYWHLI